MRTALYPGSFDPLTLGHLNVIERGLRLFDRLVVAVAHNVRKQCMFTPARRVQMIEQSISHPRLQVDCFDGLLVDYARAKGVHVVLRGLRAVSDFEFEFQLAHLNRRLGQGLETLFVMTGESHFYVSSQVVRDIAQHGGDVSGLVPPAVCAHLEEVCRPKPLP